MRACVVHTGAVTADHSFSSVARMQLVVCCSVWTWILVDLTLGVKISILIWMVVAGFRLAGMKVGILRCFRMSEAGFKWRVQPEGTMSSKQRDFGSPLWF